MSVGLVIVTHGQIGHSLVESAEFILGLPLDRVLCVAVTQSGSEAPDANLIRQAIRDADQGEGVLVMTDLPCASPSNIVEREIASLPARLVSGVNLPMLLRAWNYRSEPLDYLAERALEGGIRGIERRGA